LAWDGDGTLFATEHGPSGADGPGGYDEVNLLQAGTNYGWPGKYCATTRAPLPEGVTTRDPLACYEEAIAPAGMAWVPHDRYPGWQGSLLFGTLRGEHLHRIRVEGGQVTQDEQLFEGTYGRLRDAVVGPDGLVHFTTSNQDGRGSPKDGDDHVYRIVPGPAALP
jgi:glucose/arabinose dehydrogenase